MIFRKARLRSVFIIAPLVVLTSLSSAQKPPVSIFQERYDTLTRAMLAKDMKTLGNLISVNFKGGSYAKPMDRAMYLQQCAQSPGIFKTKTRKVLSAMINKNKASVLIRSMTYGKMPDPKSGANHDFSIELLSADTWETGSKGWQLKHAKVIHTKVLADGKPFKGRFAH